jgi:tRNA-Thr(GGU) m(6)t(6)A37 methyltransferase TsaA
MEFIPIGVICTPFPRAQGTPIQSAVAGEAEGRVEVYPEFAEGLKDLDGFDRIWLLYWFDRAVAARLLVTPYLDEAERGVFATRAPCRPNPIGMSSVRLERVDGNVLLVRGVDMLDGTPLLDIKPYAPRFDHFEAGRCGWLDTAGTGRGRADERFSAGQDGDEQ